MSRKTRKLIWSVPLVAVFAVVGALAMFMALAPNDVSAQAGTAPGQPGELMAMPFEAGIPEEQIELKWTAPSSGGPPTHYRIDISMNGGNTWTAMRSNITGDRFLHTGLKAGQMFHYRIFAYNGQTIGPMSNVASATTAMAMKPETPIGLNAQVGDETGATVPATAPGTATIADTDTELTITLTWSAPPDPDGAPVLGYVVQYALHESPGAWTQVKVVGDVETTSHDELEAGRGYRYRIAAYNKTMKVDGKDVPDPNYMSGWSVPASDNTLVGAVPATPTALPTGVSPAEEKIFLFWTPPGDPLGDPITHYIVQGRPTADADGGTLDEAAAPFQTIKDNISSSTAGGDDDNSINSFEVTLRDVRANTSRASLFKTDIPWAYQVAAKNRAASKAAATLNYTTPIAVAARAPEAPLAPVNLRVAPDTDANDGRTALELTWNTAKGVGVPAVIAADGTVTTAAVPPQPATSYSIQYSDTGPSDPEGYNWKVLGTVATPATGETQTFTDGTADVTDVDRLAAGQTRHYRVIAVNTDTSWPSNPQSGTTRYPNKPSPPTNPGASPGGHTSINLRWTAPDAGSPALDGSEEGASVIKGYYIQYLEEDGTAWQYIKNDAGGNLIPPIKDSNGDGKDDNGRSIVFESTGALRTFTNGKLAPNTTREYRIAAVNMIRTAEQPSDWTTPVSGMTVPIPAPNAPAGFIAEAMGHDSIFLSWLAQAEVPEHAEVSGYVIQYRDGKTGDFMDLMTVTEMTDMAVHTIYTDDTVSAGTTRYYRVYAENAKGRSDQFDTAMATTDDAPPNNAPMAPTAMLPAQTVTIGTPVMVQSTITDADMDDTLTWSAASDMEMYATATVNDMGMVTITGVAAGSATIAVTAMDAAGESAMQTIAVTVEAANAAPVATVDPGDVLPGEVSLVVGGDDEVITLTDSFIDPDGDTLTYSATSDMEMYATATVSDDDTMLTIAAVAAGMATVTVTAYDGNGGSATHDIAVTVTAPLMAPSIKGTNPVGSGIVLVSWDAVDSATGYSLIATNLSDPSAPTRTAAADADDESGQIQNLTPGDEYLIFVGAFNDDLEFTLSDYVKITVEP